MNRLPDDRPTGLPARTHTDDRDRSGVDREAGMRHEHGDPIQRMNRDHADQVLTIARVLAGHPDATSAHIELVDPRGVDLCVETPTGPTTARVDFAEPLPPDDRPENIRVAFVRLARRARNESSIE